MKFAYADQLSVGLAGEHLVCADLLSMGYSPFRTEQPAPYDIAVDVGSRIIRLQVKATVSPRPFAQSRQRHITGYTWNTRHGKGARRSYYSGLIDGFALVALDIRSVAYVVPGRQIFQIPVSGARKSSRTFKDFSFTALLKGVAA